MAMDWNSHAEDPMVSCHEVLVLVEDIESQLEEILDVDAEDSGEFPPMPVHTICDQVVNLEHMLDGLFESCEQGRTARSRVRSRIADRDITLLRRQQEELRIMVEDLRELAGTAIRPTTTWPDLAARFRTFRRDLNHHLEACRESYGRAVLPV